jgi:hypothetical protein
MTHDTTNSRRIRLFTRSATATDAPRTARPTDIWSIMSFFDQPHGRTIVRITSWIMIAVTVVGGAILANLTVNWATWGSLDVPISVVVGGLVGSVIGLPPLAVTFPTARQISGLGFTTLWKLAREGRLEVVRIGRRTLITHRSLARLLLPPEPDPLQPRRRGRPRKVPTPETVACTKR